jgi:adenylate cyclase
LKNGTPERRLAAIVAMDVVGYSRLMGADEEGTLTTLKAHQDILTPMVQDHGGRLVSTAGDGLLLEFPSVVEALTCSIKMQDVMEDKNKGITEDKQMLFRIGINLGDIIIHTDDDVFGEGVNVAARIEQLSPSGGICISRTVHDNVRDRMDVNFEDMGEVDVKNITRPIRVFRVLKEGEVAAPPLKSKASWQKSAIVAAVVIALIVGGASAWLSEQPDFEPADPSKYAFAIPDKPSIAVLPFNNLTGDKDQEYLSDGLTENIIAVLASTPEMIVIARNSTFAFKGKAAKVQEIAEQLGVRYILEGSIQKDGNKLRVTAQLIDALNGQHLWAERFDEDIKGIFELQDTIARKISDQMEVNLTIGKQAATWRKFYDTPELFDVMLKGRVAFQTFSPEGHQMAERLWRDVHATLKDKAFGNYLLAYIYLQKGWIGISEDYAKDFAIAKKYAQEALAANPKEARNHVLMSFINQGEGKFEAAIKNIDDALKILPGGGDENIQGGDMKIYVGQPAEGVKLLEKGMRLEPDYPHYAIYTLAMGYRLLGDYKKSKTISLASLDKKSDDVRLRHNSFANLSIIAILEDDAELAKDYIRQLLAEYPTANMSTFVRNRPRHKDKASFDKWMSALRTAGLPEHPPAK